MPVASTVAVSSVGASPSAGVVGSLASICKRPEFVHATLNVTVVVFAWRRLESLRRLLVSLEGAEYCGARVPLVMMADAGSSADVLAYVQSFGWSHGTKELVLHEGPARGIRGMWIHMFRTLGERNVLPFEDDIEVSPLYYWWLVRSLHEYGPLETAAQVRAKKLAGVALYTPRLNEIQYPQVKWRASKEGGMHSGHAFLLQVPCSWGALIFGAYVADFLAFFDARSIPPFYNFSAEAHQTGYGKDRQALGDPRVRLPNARCNTWARSWKRFLIDFMYGRGLVMLYPSFDNERCFATTYMERGGHSGKDGKMEAIASSSLRRDLDPYKTPPLFAADTFDSVAAKLDRPPREGGLPPYAQLPVFSLHHNRRHDVLELGVIGANFLAKVHERGRESADAAAVDRLVELWRGTDGVAPQPRSQRDNPSSQRGP